MTKQSTPIPAGQVLLLKEREKLKKNSDNPRRGKEFQKLAASILSDYWKVPFDMEVPFQIGDPPKLHKFDLASDDGKYIGESKNYSWTEAGNMPSAKMAFLNQAVLFLSYLPASTARFIVMRRDVRQRTSEALADYYYRTYQHLLKDILIVEIDATSHDVRILNDNR